MAVVAIVETAVTTQQVAPIRTMCVVQIQVLIAANQVKLVVMALVVVPDKSVMKESVAIDVIAR
ncbi:MAG: hypothetical protein MUO22_02025 [Sedimentisphaerales bacterium]|nr:hypothetical protein [Sedimentisphaerales bacterium]